ncbi:tensin-like isoform X3 [Paramuricea clavata]|nr:tensin-like isoform X3 [Paramuricea clavata]
MKMKCRAEEGQTGRDLDYPGETKMAKYNGDSNVFQFPVMIGEQQIRDENRKAAMNELLGNLGVNAVAMERNGESTTTVTITKQVTQKNPQPPQRQSSFKAAEKIKMKKGSQRAVSPTSPGQNFEVPLIQTAPNEDRNLYYASHYAASQPGKVKAKLHIDPHSGGQISPTASPELIANRKMLLDVIEGDSGDDLDAGTEGEVTVVRKTEARDEDSDTESEDEISFHESPTLPRRGNVAQKVQFLSKSVAFAPPPDSEEQNKRKNTSVPLIGLTPLAATDITDRIAKHNEKSLAAGQVMATANMVLYSSKQPPKRVVEYNPDAHEHNDEQVEDFRSAPVLRHHQEGWNKVETNDSDTSDVHSDQAIEEDFPPPPPEVPPPPVVQTIKLGQQAEFRLNVQVSSAGKLEPVHESEDPSDSGCETSAPLSPPAPEIKIEEPAIRKQLVQVEESVDDALLEELFRNAPEQQVQPSKQDHRRDISTPVDHTRQASSPVRNHTGHNTSPVTVVIKRPDSEERYIREDDAAGYERIEDIKPGKGQEDVDMKEVEGNGMTDEEFLNSYKPIPDKPKDLEISPASSPTTSPTDTMKKTKLSPAERGPAVLNELINGIRTMKQEMSYKAKEQSGNSDVFPTSPTSDKSSSSLSPTSTLSRGKRKHRKGSDRGYGSTNSSLSESELFVEIPKNPSVKFDKDTSAFWYKPHITREQAIALLQDKPPGTFVIRDSQSYTGAFGLAVKVEVPPMHVIQNQNKDFEHIDPSEFVRHLLIESTPKGVHLKDCKDEPLFGSLAAFVYQHSLTEISLPCKLVLPTKDLTVGTLKITDRQETEVQLLTQGAACNVAYLGSFNVESLTGPAALKYAVAKIEPGRKNKEHEPVLVNFKINKQGITLTDNDRKLFFRKHYPLKHVLYWGTDPDDTRWDLTEYGGGNLARSFVFVSRKFDSDGNECHLFAEMDPKQPASTVVDVITKIVSNVSS